jgi:hypothetical protein
MQRSQSDGAIDLALRILVRIQQHTIDNPIRIKTLAAEFAIDERRVKACVLRLIDTGHKIGSIKNHKKPMGVFIATRPSEIKETARRIHDEGIALLVRASRLLHDWGSQPSLAEGIIEAADEDFWRMQIIAVDGTDAEKKIDAHVGTPNSNSGGLCPANT